MEFPADVHSPDTNPLREIYLSTFHRYKTSVEDWVKSRKAALFTYFQRKIRFELRGSYYWGLNHVLSDVNVHINPSDYDRVLLYYKRTLNSDKTKILTSTTKEGWKVIIITGGRLIVKVLAIPKSIDSMHLSRIYERISEKFNDNNDRYNYIIDVMIAKMRDNVIDETRLKKWLYIP